MCELIAKLLVVIGYFAIAILCLPTRWLAYRDQLRRLIYWVIALASSVALISEYPPSSFGL